MRCLICQRTFLAPAWQAAQEFNEENLRNDPRSRYRAAPRVPGVPTRLQTIEPFSLAEQQDSDSDDRVAPECADIAA